MLLPVPLRTRINLVVLGYCPRVKRQLTFLVLALSAAACTASDETESIAEPAPDTSARASVVPSTTVLIPSTEAAAPPTTTAETSTTAAATSTTAAATSTTIRAEPVTTVASTPLDTDGANPFGGDDPEDGLMPSVLCMVLQDAQDEIQDHGVFLSRSEDASGEGRMQIMDSHWIVVDQFPAPGMPIDEGEAVLFVVKTDEPSGC